ncbi:MAG TPA: HNH endonuclease [Nitrospiria bacterium]|jgi:5-methylcytosine-specific restriction endonuclease McrA|nr:HNH endonuclease [Nitrospiria bacterium]
MLDAVLETHRVPPVHSLMTLVLNADYQALTTFPLSLIPATEAITRIWKERAQTVETWKDAFGDDRLFRSPSVIIPAPKVVVLKEYVSISSEPKFSRRNIILRDRFICQYCAGKFSSNDLTFDHVIPKKRGGVTEWTNIVASCEPCNSEKGDIMPNLSGKKGKGSWRPMRLPMRPTNAQLLKAGLEFLPEQMKEDFGSWLYWNVEIEKT